MSSKAFILAAYHALLSTTQATYNIPGTGGVGLVPPIKSITYATVSRSGSTWPNLTWAYGFQLGGTVDPLWLADWPNWARVYISVSDHYGVPHFSASIQSWDIAMNKYINHDTGALSIMMYIPDWVTWDEYYGGGSGVDGSRASLQVYRFSSPTTANSHWASTATVTTDSMKLNTWAGGGRKYGYLLQCSVSGAALMESQFLCDRDTYAPALANARNKCISVASRCPNL